MEKKKEPRIVESGPIGIKVNVGKAMEDFLKAVMIERLQRAAAELNKENE